MQFPASSLFACLAAAAALAGARASFAQSSAPIPNPSGTPDPFLWLEDVNGARATAWVKAENAKTLGVLEKDPRFAGLYADALKIAEDKDRVPQPEFVANDIYNFWQDAAHVRGIWRKASIADFASPAPAWKTVLDLDALAKSQNANWVWQGADCVSPGERRCLVSLSDGGEDASTVREFDLGAQRFVEGGFELPRGKQNATWESQDSILVAREWAPGELTTSGYPFVVKRLRRGQPLSAAVEIFRGSPSDVGINPYELHDADGHRALFIDRGVTFFQSETYVLTAQGARRVNIPPKASLVEMVAGRIIAETREDWKVEATTFPAGSVVALDFAALIADPEHPKPTLVYAPGPRESFEGLAVTKSHLLISTYENVRGRASVYSPAAAGWTSHKLDLPDDSTISIASANRHGDTAFLNVTGFLTPPSLLSVNATTGSLATVKAQPALFDGSKDVVEQHEATSKDGTRIPYFIVHPKNMRLDGSNPTILWGYG